MRKRFYDDPKENAAFERCVDVMTSLIKKYGPALKRKWIMEAMLVNIWLDVLFIESVKRRMSGYLKMAEKKKTGSEKGHAA